MGSKKIRSGKITHIGPLLKDRYELGSEYVVQVVVTVQDGPDAGREIRVELDTLEALYHSRNIEQARHEAHDKQRAHDAPETNED